jgi:protein-disulfide isomerase
MKPTSLASRAAAIVAGVILLAPAAIRAQALREPIDAIVTDYLTTHPDHVGELVYLINQPEAIGETSGEQLKRRPAADAVATVAADRSAAVASNAALLFSSPHQVTLGDPEGDVTLVEFFDYNCGFCKRALPDMLTLLRNDPKLKVVLKELPILGPGSIEAARVAVAVRMQDPGGRKYLGFHQQLLGGPGPVSKDKALAVAKDQGLDMASLEHDIASAEVRATIAEDVKLASAVGITGTPGYVIGNNVVLGAVGVTALRARIEAARGQRTN